MCGTSKVGVSLTPGVLPTSAGFISVSIGNYTEYHICGDLTLSGTGYLTGSAPGSDTVIVIENGSLNVANNASINTLKTAIVMTGDNTVGSSVNFPNGNGHGATLSLSPPTDPANPWQGVALYQDPKLTNNVNNTWGPGASFNADGLVYLGNSNVVTDGDTASSNAKCTKFVMNQFTTNGHVDLNFTQSASTCAAIGLSNGAARSFISLDKQAFAARRRAGAYSTSARGGSRGLVHDLLLDFPRQRPEGQVFLFQRRFELGVRIGGGDRLA